MSYKILVAFIFVFLKQSCCFKNPPTPVKTVKVGNDIIDCIKREEQIAFDHPLLKDHKIQKPPAPPKGARESTKRLPAVPRKKLCPKGTIPVRRRYNETFVPIKSWPDVNSPGHEYAIAIFNQEYVFGTHVVVSVWEPIVEVGSEFSLSQIWLSSGDHESDLNTIEVGWQVYPEMYGDSLPHLFVYWTSDNYGPSGCYNLDCPGFVQTNDDIVPGNPLSSSSPGYPIELTFQISKNLHTRDWWLSIRSEDEDKEIGYWPAHIFTHLQWGPAEELHWGGEITNRRTSQRHTYTQMGSGQFASQTDAGYFRSLVYLDHTNTIQHANAQLTIDNPDCYDAKIVVNVESGGADLFYGGPGYSYTCN